MDITFTNLKELYERVLPALKAKSEELRRLGFEITERQIWDFLKEKKWKNSYNLLLYQMVDDIINLENIVIIDYYKKD